MLHLDVTCDGQEPLLMSGLDSMSQIVLGNVKSPSENADSIIPFLKQIRQLFGDLVTSVHDMGTGIIKAVATVFPGTPDFICYYHFPRDVSKDLLQTEYDKIRNRLRKRAITSKLRAQARKLKKIIDDHPQLIEDFHRHVKNKTASQSGSIELISTISTSSLILWILDGKNQDHGYGFPFDRPHFSFAQRLCSIYGRLEQRSSILNYEASGATIDRCTVCHVS